MSEEQNYSGMNIEALTQDIHSRNAHAGWWTDLATGESTLATRDRGRILALVTSEVSEAHMGRRQGLMDDKLTHLPMFNVELADVAIRLSDAVGAETALHGPKFIDFDKLIEEAKAEMLKEAQKLQVDFHKTDIWFTAIVNKVSAALEYERKTRIPEYRQKLSEALATTFAVAHLFEVDLMDVIEQKLHFNASREDHKIESRRADGGKKS